MISNRLMRYMAVRHAESTDKRLGNISISDIPYCSRKIAYKLHGHAPTNRPQPGAMEVGTIMHAALQKWAKEVFGDDFYGAEREVLLAIHYHDPRTNKMEVAFLKGHCDGIHRKFGVIDFKTYRGVAWKYRAPLKQNYIDQLLLYMEALKEQGVKQGVIVHVCKDDLGMDESRVTPNQTRVKKLMGKAADIMGAETPEEFPDKPEYDWECRYCQYKDLCKGEK